MRARTASSHARLEGESPPFRARLGKRPGTSGNAFIALKNQQKKRICHVWMLLAKFTGGMLYHARFSSRGVQRDRGHDRHFCVLMERALKHKFSVGETVYFTASNVAR